MLQEQNLSGNFSYLEIHKNHVMKRVQVEFFFFSRWTELADTSFVPKDLRMNGYNKYGETLLLKNKSILQWIIYYKIFNVFF